METRESPSHIGGTNCGVGTIIIGAWLMFFLNFTIKSATSVGGRNFDQRILMAILFALWEVSERIKEATHDCKNH